METLPVCRPHHKTIVLVSSCMLRQRWFPILPRYLRGAVKIPTFTQQATAVQTVQAWHCRAPYFQSFKICIRTPSGVMSLSGTGPSGILRSDMVRQRTGFIEAHTRTHTPFSPMANARSGRSPGSSLIHRLRWVAQHQSHCCVQLRWGF